MICPIHKIPLRKRDGKFGAFFGCVHWPHCDIIGDHGYDGREVYSTQSDRAERRAAHDAFDRIWMHRHMTRRAAYAWLAASLALPASETHIKYFDAKTCRRVVEIARAQYAALSDARAVRRESKRRAKQSRREERAAKKRMEHAR